MSRSDERISVAVRINRLFLASVVSSLALVFFAGDATAQQSLNDFTRQRQTATERLVFVRSNSLLVKGAVVKENLLKNHEVKELGFAITRDSSQADMILELRHDLLTKYVFSVIDNRTGAVVAAGKLSSLGGTVADKVAKQFVKKMKNP